MSWVRVLFALLAMAGLAKAHDWPKNFPSAPETFGFKSRYVQVARGVNLHVVDRPGTDPALPPAVFVHAMEDTWHGFEKLYGELGTSRRVIALDQRGHGDSDKPPDAPYSVQMFTEDLKAVLDALGVERIGLLVGHSMGSWVGWHFAGTWPASVERLLLIGTSADWPDYGDAEKEILKRMFKHGGKPVTYEEAYEEVKSPAGGCVSVADCGQWFFDTEVYGFMKFPTFVTAHMLANENPAKFRATANELVPKITAATTIIRGENDAIQSEATNERMLALLEQGEACQPSLKVIPGQNHNPNWTYKGASVIVAALQELLASSPHCHGTAVSALSRAAPATNPPSPVAALTLVVALVLATATSIRLATRSRRSAPLGEVLLDAA